MEIQRQKKTDGPGDEWRQKDREVIRRERQTESLQSYFSPGLDFLILELKCNKLRSITDWLLLLVILSFLDRLWAVRCTVFIDLTWPITHHTLQIMEYWLLVPVPAWLIDRLIGLFEVCLLHFFHLIFMYSIFQKMFFTFYEVKNIN